MKTSTHSQTKFLLVLFFCFASVASVMSQSESATFSILPSGTVTATAACGTSFNEYIVYISNPTSSDLDLSYAVVDNTMPSDACWEYEFCDWDVCISGLPTGNTTNHVLIDANTQSSMMKLGVITNNNKGQGSLVLDIFETNNPSNSVTATWIIDGCLTGTACAAGIFENSYNNNFVIYPNPAGDYANVEITKDYKPGGSVQVYNIVGEKLIEYPGIKTSTLKIDLTTLPAGGYFIKYSDGKSVSAKKFFKTN